MNWYDGGRHSIGYHSDDEKGLVPGAPIFAVSWGAQRPLNDESFFFNFQFTVLMSLKQLSCVIFGHESFVRSHENEHVTTIL